MIHTVQSLRQQYIELIKLIPPPKFIQSGLLSGFERFLIIQIDFLYFHYNLELQRTLKPLNISNLYTAECSTVHSLGRSNFLDKIMNLFDVFLKVIAIKSHCLD